MGLSACAFGYRCSPPASTRCCAIVICLVDRCGRRGVQRLLRHPGRPAVAGGDARHADRLSRPGPGDGRGSQHQRLSRLVRPRWARRGCLGPVPFALVAFVVLFALLYVVLERSGLRPAHLCDRLEPRCRASLPASTPARHKMVLFIASGVVSAFAGLLYAARVGAVRGDVGNGFELDIITIVLLGGVSDLRRQGHAGGHAAVDPDRAEPAQRHGAD